MSISVAIGPRMVHSLSMETKTLSALKNFNLKVGDTCEVLPAYTMDGADFSDPLTHTVVRVVEELRGNVYVVAEIRNGNVSVYEHYIIGSRLKVL